MCYGRSQCALHHSILSSVKLFFDECTRTLWDGLSVTNYFALVATLGFFYKLHIRQLGAEVNCCSEIVIKLPVLKRKNQNTNHLFV